VRRSEEKLRDLSESSGDTKWLDYTTAIEEYLTEQGLLDKGIAPNVDFYSGSVYDSLGIPVDMYTPIFAMSRAGGWIAHMVEYQEDNRLIRPRARGTPVPKRPSSFPSTSGEASTAVQNRSLTVLFYSV